ncbi:hypothetical protein DRF65_16120 [Chryseobacterium pennae]|uniref:Uncharacterized protein n=1 Tax=Chryseobacterium pennae TaxID=2258962 RepID=A0A3D9C7J6_9FLAO|nr:hypothetical protein [Chryseobacterium pennae]REC61462.1 hypothetical protein DRF65_16120 [Chryseobacterium pennae]
MSKIAIIINNDSVSANTLFELKKVTGESVDAIRKNISDHKPIVEGLLFYNDHDEVSEKLFKVVRDLAKNDITYSIFELEEDEEYNTIDSKNQEISADTLYNIIEEHNREIRRQEDL